MSVKNSNHNNRADVLLAGPLKKLKTTRKKWFVLRAETPETSARIEYYDSERKFKNGLPPKRSIPLKTCFNINKRHDTKHKHVIALYTKDDCFCVILETEDELETWLKALLSLQRGEDSEDGEMPRPTFEHVWQVAVLNRGLGTDRTGNYRLCLTDKTLCLIKVDNNSIIDLNLGNIRSCGSLKNYFFLEIGRSSLLGAGELWMDTEDANIAQNIHSTIFHAMSTNVNREELAPKLRTRSSSATEASKPINNGKKQVLTGVPKPHVYPQAGGGVPSPGIINHQRTQSLPLADHTTTTNASSIDNTIPSLHSSSRAASIKRPSKCLTSGRERCDSMPSRPRTTSGDSVHQAIPGWRSFLTPHRSQGRDVSHSPPSGSPVSPPSVGCSTDSAGSSYSLQDEGDVCPECPEGIRYNMPLTPDEAIVEEECPDSPYGDNYVPMAPPSSDDGYVDMSPRCQHNANSPTVSLTSVTSGTPSTDLRFSDYPLDKVSSYFPSVEDDARPARAYSVGSRPETYRNKRHMELAGTPENSRVRAFSVGSKKLPGRVLPPHHSHSGFKSSSAPILSNSKTYSSHSSIGPMEDLMEMDFSRTSTNNVNTETTTNSGYVEMKPGVDLAQRNPSVDNSPYVDMSSGSVYMDMSGTSPSRTQPAQTQQDYNSFVDINRQYGLNEQSRNYVDMDQRRKRVMSTTSNSNVSTSPSSAAWIAEDYLDMSANNSRYQESISVSPVNNADYMPVNYNQDKPKPPETQPKTPDGYVEMTVGRSHHRQSSLDGTLVGSGNDSYANMSLGQGAKKKHPKKEKAISQPISIYPNVTTSSSATKNSSSPMSISSLLGRKPSSGTPPRMHLPLSSWTSSYSSLPRQRSRKNSQTNSKDSSSSSITTPSNSSTIFPLSLNSPSSPMKPTKSETPVALKIPAALFNALYKSSKSNAKPANNDDYTVMDFEANRNKPSNDAVNSDYVNFSSKNEDAIRSNSKQPGDERVKAETAPSVGGRLPLLAIQDTHFRPIVDDQKNGDYLFISPKTAINETKDVTKSRDTASSNAVDPLYETLRSVESAKISPVNFASSGNSKNSSPCPGVLGDNSRPSSVSSETSKGVVSRPSSTSSELWSSSSTVISCPIESTGTERAPQDSDSGASTKPEGKLHYASLDLAQSQDEEDSQSPKSAKSSGGSDAVAQPQAEPTFVYAEIDFIKSEGLKQNNQSVPTTNKVKHV